MKITPQDGYKTDSTAAKPAAPELDLKELLRPGTNAEHIKDAQQQNGVFEKVESELTKMELESARAMSEIPARLTESKVQESSKDAAELSEESRGTKEPKSWEPNAEAKAWQEILSWRPSADRDVIVQMRELREIYIRLLQQILINVPVEGQQQYIDKLRQILVSRMDGLLSACAPELKLFLSAYGNKSSLDRLEKALYFAVTGKEISIEAIRKEWVAASRTGQQYVSGSEEADFMNGKPHSSITAAKTADSTAGSLYSRQGRKQAHGGSSGAAEKMLSAVYAVAREPAGRGASRSQSAAAEETMALLRDMQKAEQFVKALGGTAGSILDKNVFTAKNESLYGFLWAMESGKTKLFVSHELNPSPLKQEIETAVERMISVHIQRASKGDPQSDVPGFKQEQAYEIYRYAMKQYYAGEEIHKALRDGFYYALKYFFQKKGSVGEREHIASEQQTGFFQENLRKDSIRQELAAGTKILEEDWKQFLAKMGYEERPLQLSPEIYSPWRMAVKPEKEPDDTPQLKGEAFAVAGGITAVFVIVLLILVFS